MGSSESAVPVQIAVDRAQAKSRFFIDKAPINYFVFNFDPVMLQMQIIIVVFRQQGVISLPAAADGAQPNSLCTVFRLE